MSPDRLADGTEVEVTSTREMIEVRSAWGVREADPSWRFTDAAGHEHTAEIAETAEWRITESYWCADCGDEHTDGEWRCRLCEEVIEPGTRFASPTTAIPAIPGLWSGTVTTEGPMRQAHVPQLGGSMIAGVRVRAVYPLTAAMLPLLAVLHLKEPSTLERLVEIAETGPFITFDFGTPGTPEASRPPDTREP